MPPSSYKLGLRPADLAALVPPRVAGAIGRALTEFQRRIEGFAGPAALLLGPETRGSAPVRVLRHPSTLEAEGVEGLYPAGEGAGYGGGIVTAAVDGLRTAEAVLARYAPRVGG
ncbi:MAG: hypothetical protein HY722_12205 [Planctomycetes bacterium]|nr:hypothetical protein [Planctomycetota bacterium]